MPERPQIWLVIHHEELVAELAVERVDRRWLRGSVTRRARFEVLAPLSVVVAHPLAPAVDKDEAFGVLL